VNGTRDKVKVIVIGPRLPVVGGISVYISNLEKYLIEEEIEIFSVTPYVFHMADITVKTVVNTRFMKNIFFKIYTLFINMIKILSYSKQVRLIAHIHSGDKISFVENSLYVLLLRSLNIPIILHVHATTFHLDYKKGNLLIKTAIKYVFNKSDIIIVLSNIWKKICEDVMDIPHGKLEVVHNAIDVDTFRPISKTQCTNRLQLPQNKKILFAVGSLIERKGFNYLVDAMKIVTEKRKGVLCFIGGSGQLEGVLQKQITELDLQTHIKLIGFVSDELLPIWMNACDVFVLPSVNESFGLVQVEAMACGTPVVATYNDGSEDVIISEEYGLLVKSMNPKELAEKILISLEKDWDESTIRKYAERYRWETTIKETIYVYQQLLRRTE